MGLSPAGNLRLVVPQRASRIYAFCLRFYVFLREKGFRWIDDACLVRTFCLLSRFFASFVALLFVLCQLSSESSSLTQRISLRVAFARNPFLFLIWTCRVYCRIWQQWFVLLVVSGDFPRGETPALLDFFRFLPDGLSRG